MLEAYSVPAQSTHKLVRFVACRLIRLLFLTLMLSVIVPAAFAAGFQLSDLSYQNGVLTLSANGKVRSPAMEVWPGSTGPKPTELVILKFTQANGDFKALQQSASQILQSNPSLKKFLIGPLNSEQGELPGIQIALEFEIPDKMPPDYVPLITETPQNQLVIALLPSVTSNLKHTNAPLAQPVSITDDPPKEPVKKLPTSIDMNAQQSTNPSVLALETEIAQLKKALQTSNQQQESLRIQLESYEAPIREHAPEVFGSGSKIDAQLQVVKSALSKVASRLKATEAQLVQQKAQNQELTRQLASQKKTLPNIQPEPSVWVHLAEPAGKPASFQQLYSAEEKSPNPSMLTEISLLEKRKPASLAEKAALLEDAIRENPRKYADYLALADLYEQQGQLSSAENILTLLIRQNPVYSMGYYKLAWIYIHQNRKTEAQAAFNQFQTLKPEDQVHIRSLQQALQTSTKFSSTSGKKN